MSFDPTEVHETLHARIGILRALGVEARPKQALLDRCAVSRSTLDRGVRDLVAAGLAERHAGRVRRTVVGELALAEYQRYLGRLSELVDAAPVVSSLPADAPLDAAVLDGARIVRVNRNAPQGPLGDMKALVERATDSCALVPAVFGDQVETYHRRIVEEGLTARVSLTPDALQSLLSSFPELTREALDTGRLTLRQVDGIPYSLTVAETPDGPEVGLLVYTEGGIRGYVGNADPNAVAWARDEFERWWQDADPLPSAGVRDAVGE